MSPISDTLTQFGQFFIENPSLHIMQAGLLFLATVTLFLLFFTLRDILLRSRSFAVQFLCILLVAVLPIVGFLLYLIVRPSRTLKERELEAMLLTLVATEAPEQVTVGEVTPE